MNNNLTLRISNSVCENTENNRNNLSLRVSSIFIHSLYSPCYYKYDLVGHDFVIKHNLTSSCNTIQVVSCLILLWPSVDYCC